MKRHPLDAVSMVFGLLFVGLGSLYLSGNEVDDLVIRFWPAALVVLGLAILFSARRSDEVPAAPEDGTDTARPAE